MAFVPDLEPKDITNPIKRCRYRKDGKKYKMVISQSAMARKLKISQSFICKVETGINKPSLELLMALYNTDTMDLGGIKKILNYYSGDE